MTKIHSFSFSSQALIADPRHGLEKTYWANSGRTAETRDPGAIAAWPKNGRTRPARVRLIAEPKDLWPREPPIRHRAAIATVWVEISLHDGRNPP